MQPAQTPVMIRLGDHGKTVANPAEDIRGRSVVDGDGNPVGRVVDLLIDDDHRKVRFLRIKHGGFLGIGAEEIFIPAEAIVQVLGDEVRIDQTRQHLAGAPTYDPELGEDLPYLNSLYGYYGIAPYWGPSMPMGLPLGQEPPRP